MSRVPAGPHRWGGRRLRRRRRDRRWVRAFRRYVFRFGQRSRRVTAELSKLSTAASRVEAALDELRSGLVLP